MSDAPHLPEPAVPARPDADVVYPTAWAGGRQVVVPGVGVGRVVQEGPPRVVEIPLGAPVATVLTLDSEIGAARALILVDPGVAPEQLDRLLSAGELLDAEAPAIRPHSLRIPRPRPGRGTACLAFAIASGAAALGVLFAGDSDRMIDADAPRTTASDGAALTAAPAV